MRERLSLWNLRRGLGARWRRSCHCRSCQAPPCRSPTWGLPQQETAPFLAFLHPRATGPLCPFPQPFLGGSRGARIQLRCPRYTGAPPGASMHGPTAPSSMPPSPAAQQGPNLLPSVRPEPRPEPRTHDHRPAVPFSQPLQGSGRQQGLHWAALGTPGAPAGLLSPLPPSGGGPC